MFPKSLVVSQKYFSLNSACSCNFMHRDKETAWQRIRQVVRLTWCVCVATLACLVTRICLEMTQTDRLIIRQADSQTIRQTGCMHGKTDKLGKEGLHRGQVTPKVLWPHLRLFVSCGRKKEMNIRILENRNTENGRNKQHIDTNTRSWNNTNLF